MFPVLMFAVLVADPLPAPRYAEILPTPHFPVVVRSCSCTNACVCGCQNGQECRCEVVRVVPYQQLSYRIGSLPQNFVPPAPQVYYNQPVPQIMFRQSFTPGNNNCLPGK